MRAVWKWLVAVCWLAAAAANAQPSAIQQAVQSGNVEAVRALLAADPSVARSADAEGDTPLHVAAGGGQLAIALLLLAQGADLDGHNSANQTPLLYAAYGGHLAVLDTFLARGAACDYRDTRGNSPLHFAARQGHLPVVERLLARGVPFDEPGAAGRTPLHMAAWNGHAPIVQLLADRGARIGVPDESGATPLESALSRSHVAAAELLLVRGAALPAEPPRLAALLNGAAAAGSQPLVDVLLAKGAPLDGRDERGRTALHAAAAGGLAGLAAAAADRLGGVDLPDSSGQTPLYDAVARGHREVVALLLDRGADPNRPGATGLTPLYLAQDQARPEIAADLRAHGVRVTARPVIRLAPRPGRAMPQASGGDQAVGGAEPVRVTYVGNEGFLIARGGKKILVDALTDNPWGYVSTGPRVFDLMLAGTPPFDGVDLCLASHAHADHFDAALTARLLRAQPQMAFVSSPEAVAQLLAAAGADSAALRDRVTAVDPPWSTREERRVNGLPIAFFGVDHAPAGQRPYKTLAFVIDLDGVRLIHLADEVAANNVSHYEAADLQREGIDIAFVDRFFLEDSAGQTALRDWIKPSVLILMHAREAEAGPSLRQLTPRFPNLVGFGEQLETKLFAP